jgi:quinol monooxygenase YgiN
VLVSRRIRGVIQEVESARPAPTTLGYARTSSTRGSIDRARVSPESPRNLGGQCLSCRPPSHEPFPPKAHQCQLFPVRAPSSSRASVQLMQNRLVMAHLALSLLAPQGQAPEIAEALRSLSHRARLDRGCNSSEVYASLEDQSRLSLQQEWVAEADLARYVRSDDFTAVLALLDLAAAPPALEFQCSGRNRGLDYVAELRGVQNPAGG